MTIINRTGLYGPIGTYAELNKAVHATATLFVGATAIQMVGSEGVFPATLLLFFVAAISVTALETRRWTAVTTPLWFVTALSIIVQSARDYHLGVVPYKSVAIILALIWGMQRANNAARFLQAGS